MFLAFAYLKKIKNFQIDVKVHFFNGYILENVYVDKLSNFESHKFPNYVFKLKEALYSLKQTSRAWYNRLNNFLI